MLERLWGGAETLIVISTDFRITTPTSRRGASTRRRSRASRRCATDIDHDEACGATPLNGLLSCAASASIFRCGCSRRAIRATPRAARISVVGYSSFALYEQSDAQAGGQALHRHRARRDRRRSCWHRAPRQFDAPWLEQAGATFVTLTQERRAARLHRQPAGRAAARRRTWRENALAAAFRDPRFPALSAAEWPQCRVEVSLLSTPKPLAFADEADLLRQIRAGEDGLILEADGQARHVSAAGLARHPRQARVSQRSSCARPACRPIRAWSAAGSRATGVMKFDGR